MIRAFVALPIPDSVRTTLAAIQAQLPIGRDVAPENFHITLAFLGKHPEPVIEDLHAELSTIRQVVMDLSIDRLDVFGGAQPKSVYAGVATHPDLTILRKKVRQAANTVGIRLAAERFVPHVTLARFSKTALAEEAQGVHTFVTRHNYMARARFQADRFALYQSHLRHSGPIYEPLAEYELS